ncbi:MAG: AAA family ATPase [Acidimicrobiia bacterium]|nr:AAA family ATPase [Acidimicrobiia bacterium]
MLDELTVSNLGLIDEATIEPGRGLVVVTGETGTGKTLLLGALRLLRGETARKDRVGPHGVEARVDARFVTDDGDEMVVARRISADRSRGYLDGQMTTAADLGSRVGRLVELVAQHEHQTLTTSEGVRKLVDAALDADGKAAQAGYAEAWEHLRNAQKALEEIGGDRRALTRELEMARFQADEIRAAGFVAGDEERLRTDVTRLRHGAEIGESLAAAARHLGDEEAGEALAQAAAAIERASRLDPTLEPVTDQITEASRLVSELGAEVSRSFEEISHEPGSLDEAEDRIARLGALQRKYGADLDEVLAFGEKAEARATEIEALLDSADDLAAQYGAALAAVEIAGTELSSARQRAGERLAAKAIEHLSDLGFAEPVVRVDLQPTEPGPTGTDRILLAFASTASLEPGPVSRVASGGELSRLVLSLRLAAGVADAPVIAFDEIDAGIGGATALATGRKLADLATGRQVLAVTHLPQVAAFADAHFVVERVGDRAAVRRVDGEERIAELTRMLGGLPESERGRQHAAELLDLAGG